MLHELPDLAEGGECGAGGGHAALRGLDGAQAVPGGGDAEGAADVAADAEGGAAGGDEGAFSAGRAASRAGLIIRIVCNSKNRS